MTEGMPRLHYIASGSLQIDGGAQEYESLRLDDGKRLCGQRDTEDDSRNA